MMAKTIAYVLITCNVGKASAVLDQLEKVNNIKETSRVHGAYDVIVKMEASSLVQVQDVVADKIRTINDVRSVMSLPLKSYN